MKLIFEETRKFGYGLEEKIADAIANIGEETIKRCQQFISNYFPTLIVYIDFPLEIEEKGGEFYLILANTDDEAWVEWRTIYTDKKAYDGDIITETVATLVID